MLCSSTAVELICSAFLSLDRLNGINGELDGRREREREVEK